MDAASRSLRARRSASTLATTVAPVTGTPRPRFTFHVATYLAAAIIRFLADH
jgi:hypothetical protein